MRVGHVHGRGQRTLRPQATPKGARSWLKERAVRRWPAMNYGGGCVRLSDSLDGSAYRGASTSRYTCGAFSPIVPGLGPVNTHVVGSMPCDVHLYRKHGTYTGRKVPEIILPSARHLEERLESVSWLTVSQSVSQSVRQASSQSGNQSGKQAGRQAGNSTQFGFFWWQPTSTSSGEQPFRTNNQ